MSSNPNAIKKPKILGSNRRRTGNDSMAKALPGIALVLASVLPSALSPAPSTPQADRGPGSTLAKPAKAKVGKGPKSKDFSISVSNLNDWAKTVVVTVNDVHIEGNSGVHPLASDCELHFGAHSPNFEGDPDGLVLEPMNVCVAPFPGKTEQSNADWIAFTKQVKDTVVTVSGVPRIWPEHLEGGNEPSNPNHAVEIHPLTSVVTGGKNLDFAQNIFAGEFEGGVGSSTAQSITEKISVSVTRVGDSAEISFTAGTIGNFTLLDLSIDRTTIVSDGAGSFRMDGEVAFDDGTTAPVRIVTVKGSKINTEMQKIKSKKGKNVSIEGLVLFSLSPKALSEAAAASHGAPVVVENPLQLILYGPPESD